MSTLDTSRRPRRRAPARLDALAVLPVFYKLQGRPALLAGGGEGGAWKAELLAAAGANVRVLASEPCEEMLELLERGAAPRSAAPTSLPGSLTLERRDWTPADLAGNSLALLDTECEAEAAAFAAIARDVGTTVNVIDKPRHCDIQFGSLVNRSPLVIGISTDGAAPILGQEVRRRIEAILPPGLKDWAALMAGARTRLLRALPEPATRRAFFRRFATEAFLRAPAGEADLDRMAEEAGEARRGGSVVLVGAGPGDAKYLTLEAVRALQSADLVLYDALVSDEVLELARREARRVLVGKRAARESCAQTDINALVVAEALDGQRVVRLKSGDPMVFGRAGEEIEACEAAGVPVEIVPGVTTALALASTLKLSLTHRDHARSVRFVTGHSKAGGLPEDLDWQGLADGATTLVFYMGARVARALAARLIDAGLAPDTPALAAMSVGTPEAETRSGRLGALGDLASALKGDGPILLVVGRALHP